MEGEEAVRGLLGHLGALEDLRQACKVVYPLRDVLLVVLCGTLSGCDDFVEMAAWGRQHLGFLRGFAPFPHGVPSHATLNDVINALDADVFEECFAAWVDEVCGGAPDIVALDGRNQAEVRRHAFVDLVARFLAIGAGG
ncbi:ISAs1 family transposase [Azospirillum sp. 11R-A]|uniref:ISAs1 family transposase n=1 Tax=Azospirillum sp. 11R-A TaxID=3111634 RepID=UPI003C16D07D